MARHQITLPPMIQLLFAADIVGIISPPCESATQRPVPASASNLISLSNHRLYSTAVMIIVSAQLHLVVLSWSRLRLLIAALSSFQYHPVSAAFRIKQDGSFICVGDACGRPPSAIHQRLPRHVVQQCQRLFYPS